MAKILWTIFSSFLIFFFILYFVLIKSIKKNKKMKINKDCPMILYWPTDCYFCLFASSTITAAISI